MAGFFGEAFFGLLLPDVVVCTGLSSLSSVRDFGAMGFRGPKVRGAECFLGPFGPRLSGLPALLPVLSRIGVESTNCAIDETLTQPNPPK